MTFQTKSLHINDQFTWRGGEHQVFYLLRGLNARGHRAELVAQPQSTMGERAREAGVTVHDMRMRGEADLVAARRIARLISRERYDIVQMHTAHAHMLGALACAFNSAPLCVVSRRVDFPINAGPFGIAKLKYYWRIDAYIAVCAAIKEVLIAGGVREDKIYVVRSGATPPKVVPDKNAREELGVESGERLVGNVGALVDHKGQRYLIEAAPFVLERVPNAKFVIVGGGELERPLKELASRLNVERRVILPGHREDVGSYYKEFDVFVAPSHMDGLNNSVVEAMMMRKPVIGASAGGIPEIIDHGKDGLLVPPKDPRALAEAIVDLLEHPEKAERLAHAGYERAMSAFTADHMVEGTIEVYKKLLKDKPKT